MLRIIIVLMFSLSAEASDVPARIIKWTNTYCKNPKLARAIIMRESNFKNIVSSEGSTGLMQVKPSTAKWIGCKAQTELELLNEELNIKCGCFYLGKLDTRYDALSDVVAAYNAGSARICRTGILHPSKNKCTVGKYINEEYVRLVLSTYQDYIMEN